MMRTTPAAAAAILTPLALPLLAACGGGSRAAPPPPPGDGTGRYIVPTSDRDMRAPALARGRLGERDPGAQDTLTVLALPIREPSTPWSQINVSNSVIGPPNALAVSRDGNTAFIVESRGPAPAGA